MKTLDMDIETLCAKVYRDRLDPADRARVTDEQCRSRGSCYRSVVLSTLKHVGIELPKAEDYSDLC